MNASLDDLVRQYFAGIGLTPGIREAEPDPDACATCGGLGQVYVDVDGLDGGWKPCPDCQCPICGGLGYVKPNVPANHPAWGKFIPCPARCATAEAAYQDRYYRLLTASRLPVEYQALSFDSFMMLTEAARKGKMAAFVAARAFASSQGHWVNWRDVGAFFGRDVPEDWRNWLVLYGVHGRGKTGLAAAVVNHLLGHQQQVLYTRLQDAIRAIQSRYNQDENSPARFDVYGDLDADAVLNALKRAPVLVLDEFDEANAVKADKQSIVEAIIRFRHGEVLPTIITTNLSPDEMEARWGATTVSVIRQRAHWFEMSGENLRPDVILANWG